MIYLYIIIIQISKLIVMSLGLKKIYVLIGFSIKLVFDI